jgi:hypothetical protein
VLIDGRFNGTLLDDVDLTLRTRRRFLVAKKPRAEGLKLRQATQVNEIAEKDRIDQQESHTLLDSWRGRTYHPRWCRNMRQSRQCLYSRAR